MLEAQHLSHEADARKPRLNSTFAEIHFVQQNARVRSAVLQIIPFEAITMPQAQKICIDQPPTSTNENNHPSKRTQEAMAHPAKDRLLTIFEVIEIVKLSRSSIYALMKRGTFPKNRKASLSASRWVSTEIDSWIAGLKTGEQA